MPKFVLLKWNRLEQRWQLKGEKPWTQDARSPSSFGYIISTLETFQINSKWTGNQCPCLVLNFDTPSYQSPPHKPWQNHVVAGKILRRETYLEIMDFPASQQPIFVTGFKARKKCDKSYLFPSDVDKMRCCGDITIRTLLIHRQWTYDLIMAKAANAEQESANRRQVSNSGILYILI